MRNRSVRKAALWLVVLCWNQGCGIEEFRKPRAKPLQYDASWGVPVGYGEYKARELMHTIMEGQLKENINGELVHTEIWEGSYQLPQRVIQLNDLMDEFFIYTGSVPGSNKEQIVSIEHRNIVPYENPHDGGGDRIDSVVYAGGELRVEMQLRDKKDLSIHTILPGLVQEETNTPFALLFPRASSKRRIQQGSLAGYRFGFNYDERLDGVPLFLMRHSLNVYLDALEPTSRSPIRMTLVLKDQEIKAAYGVFHPRYFRLPAEEFTMKGVGQYGLDAEPPVIDMTIENNYGVPITARFEEATFKNSSGEYQLIGDFFEQEYFVLGRPNDSKDSRTNHLELTQKNSNLIDLLLSEGYGNMILPVQITTSPKSPYPQQKNQHIDTEGDVRVRLKMEQSLYGIFKEMPYRMSFKNDFVDDQTRNTLRPYVDQASFRVLVTNGMPLQGEASVEFMQSGISTYRMERIPLAVAATMDENGMAMEVHEELSEIVLENEALERFLASEETVFTFYFSSPTQNGEPMKVRMIGSNIFHIKLALIANVQSELY